MKRSLLIVILFCFAVQLSDAQLWKMKRWEAQAGIGPSFSFPDVGGFSQGDNLLGLRDISYRQTRFNIGGSIRYRWSRTVNTRLSLTYAMLHSTDERGSNEGRQFESLTHLFEPSMILEYYFIKNKYESSYLFLRGKSLWSLLGSLDMYAFAGVGGALYSVNANDYLTSKNQKSSGFTGVIPAGIGATLIYTPNINFGIELGGRYTLTDYLDGYHSEQFSKANDVYYLLNFTVTYKLKTSPKGLPSFR
ncbi:MAG: hypothetical protein GX431_13865 [Bacteroidales bacterium]|jgi:hypothetical protein|nr:hypothetical protein [Bacteroidales bacterium]